MKTMEKREKARQEWELFLHRFYVVVVVCAIIYFAILGIHKAIAASADEIEFDAGYLVLYEVGDEMLILKDSEFSVLEGLNADGVKNGGFFEAEGYFASENLAVYRSDVGGRSVLKVMYLDGENYKVDCVFFNQEQEWRKSFKVDGTKVTVNLEGALLYVLQDGDFTSFDRYYRLDEE